ncbi:hypothetical protein [Oricola indica]|uniref:hypothetical protein n=1 Tax=Oricola indica TaxID=2872591 RepID=UPI003CCBE36A
MFVRQILAMAAIAATTLPASARTERWSVTGTGAEATVTDCTDCEEDMGLLVRCEAAGAPATLYVPFQALEEAPAEDAEPREIVFTVDGEPFSYVPEFELWGMIGHVPRIALKPSDPLVQALRAGRMVRIALGDAAVELPLKGSWVALAAFARTCPWGEGGEAAPSEAGMSDAEWQHYAFDNDDGGRDQVLTFGIPETDAWALNVTCGPGSVEAGATVMLALSFGEREDGEAVGIRIEAGDYAADLSGTVSIQSSEYAGVETKIGMEDGFWAALAGAETLAYGIAGEEARVIPLEGVGEPLGRFLGACRRETGGE